MDLLFPEWFPLWGRLFVLVFVIVFGMCFLCMPFAVFGLKGRLNYLDQQMEDIQAQLRILLKRTAVNRERYEYKIQSASINQEETVKENLQSESQKSEPQKKATYTKERYLYPLGKEKKFPMATDSFEEDALSSSSRTYMNSLKNENMKTSSFIKENSADMGGDEARQKQPPLYVEKREDQLYDPPSPSSVEDERKIIVRKRIEPILRWPPR